MKKLLRAILCMLCTVVPAMAYTAGEYTATGAGLFGDITVTVTFNADKIVSIVVDSHSETAGIADPALEQIPAAIVANQSLALDVVTGATFTSNGIIEAVDNAAAAMTGVGEGPYVAIRVSPATIGTMGGIKVDLEMHVLKADGSIIPGLYAAGACANGDFFYQEYPASGTSNMMCFTVGRIAGTNAAECD